jgi:hypothetical protein
VSIRGVTLEEIERQRSLGWPDFHPEDFCHECGRANLSSWAIDSDRWNLAMGAPQGIVCPQCFVEKWEEATGLRAHWRLVPEAIHWPETDEG